MKTSIRGYSLIEIIIASSILGIVLAGAFGLSSQLSRTYVSTLAGLCNNRDLRAFTTEMTQEARNAERIEVYLSMADKTKEVLTQAEIDNGERRTGNLLILRYYQRAMSNGATTVSESPIRIVGYYLDTEAAGNDKPVRKFDLDKTKVPSLDLSTLPARSNSHPIVWYFAQGTASDARMFVEHPAGGALVRAAITHRANMMADTSKAYGKRVTNTYNFTIAPRT